MENNIDKANDLLFETLESLVKLHSQKLSFQQKEDISTIIDNLEEVRHLLYEFKNESKTDIA